jgi:TRAP-type C4-dicarboxylate transport system substrate-binding protein
MKRFLKSKAIFGLLIFAVVFGLAACGGGTASETDSPSDSAAGEPQEDSASDESAGETYEFSGAFIPQAGTLTIEAYEYIKDYMAEKSGGRLVLNVFPGGQLGGSDVDNAENCAQNIVQMTTAPTHTIAQYSGFLEYAATTIPFLFTSPKQVDTYIDSDLLKTVNETFTQQTGLRIYGGFCDGFMGVSTKDMDFLTPQDLSRAKIRTQNAENYINAFTEMGISAIPMSAGEIFTALQQGTIDGISGIPVMITNEHYYEILKYFVDVNAFANYHMILVNDGFYQTLPDDLKEIFDESMAELVRYTRETVTGSIESVLTLCEENGMKVTRLTDAQRQVWIDACQNTYNAMKDEVGADIIGKIEELQGR